MNKKTLLTIASSILGIGLLALLLILATSPNRTVRKFERAVLNGNYDKAFNLVSTDVSQDKIDNADLFISDWTFADEISVEQTTETAWLQRVQTDDAGNILKNEHGDRSLEIKPAPKYWARFYETDLNVEFDGFEDPITLRLRRKSNDSWSPLAQLFRGWEITKIVYQPFDDEELFGFDEFELEDGITYFEEETDDYYVYFEHPENYVITEEPNTTIASEDGTVLLTIDQKDLSSGFYLDTESVAIDDVDGYDANRYEVTNSDGPSVEGTKHLAYGLEITPTAHLVLDFIGDFELNEAQQALFDSLYIELYESADELEDAEATDDLIIEL